MPKSRPKKSIQSVKSKFASVKVLPLKKYSKQSLKLNLKKTQKEYPDAHIVLRDRKGRFASFDKLDKRKKYSVEFYSKELIRDLPDNIKANWHKTAGFEKFDSIQNLKPKKMYQMYLMLKTTGFYESKEGKIQNVVYKIPGGFRTKKEYNEDKDRIRKDIIEKVSKKPHQTGLWKVEYAFAYNPELKKLPRKNYEKRWKREVRKNLGKAGLR